jgi:hypothetical protein
MPDELTDAIKSNASGPAAATGDSGSVQQHRLVDQIEVNHHLKSAEVAANPWDAVRIAYARPAKRPI